MAEVGSWTWRLRVDWDVLQRCLSVLVLSHLVFNVSNMVNKSLILAFLPSNLCSQFPAFMMLWIGEGFMELWMTVGFVLALAKSAAQLPVASKAVFITGKK